MSARAPSSASAARRGGLACAVLVFALSGGGRAFADERSAEKPEPASEPEVFRYVEPVGAKPLRAALEALVVLGLGTALYFTTNDVSSSSHYDYTIADLGLKLTEGYDLDTNKFDTNYLTHPGAGTLYYWAARGNRLPVQWSFAYAFMASILWEVFGEFRERVSVNDMLITPAAGLVLGESTVQLGAFFDRSCATIANSVLGTVFGPAKTLNDVIDGAKPLRDTDCDRHGLTRRGDHEFRLLLGQSEVFATAGSDAAPFPETSLDAGARIIALRAYGRPGSGSRAFSDGNWAELWGRLAFARGEFGNFSIGADLVPLGVHIRDLTEVPTAAGVEGDEVLVGLLLGAEYVAHRYDGGQLSSSNDRAFVLNAPGAAVRYRLYAGNLRVDSEFQISMTFGGIEALALPEYVERASREALAPVVARNGYDHALGYMVSPRLRVTGRSFEIGAELKVMQLWAVHAFDPQYGRAEMVEALNRATGWVAFGPLIANLWVRLWGAALQRWGMIADVDALRTELRVGVGVDAAW